MKYLFLITVFFFYIADASTISFEELRKSERAEALKNFKKLYKVRQNIHYNVPYSLKNARSKNLRKNSLHFFQAKSYKNEQAQIMELSNSFLSGEVTCDTGCKNDEKLPEITEGIIGVSTTVAPPTIPGIIEADNAATSSASIQTQSAPVRKTVSSPWVRR